MSSESHGMDLLPVIGLLGAAIVAAPLFKRLGLGSVLGYLAGGVVIGPFGLRLLDDPASILQIAELGVVMFLFIIGLEMRPSRLWGLRREIFGLGAAQVGLCAVCLTAIGVFTGFPVAPSFVAGAGFVLTSTAIVMQLLEERGETSTPKGQRIVSILLLEDMSIVPLLALVAFLAPIVPGSALASQGIDWLAIGVGVASIAGLVLAGRYLLNPLFGLIASAQAREVMTAAALLVVIGSAYVMQLGGLSMAMGAFLAGVLLSESTFRHQLEADVEPFRGILLGLFFLAVGMSLDLGVVVRNWQTILFYVAAYMVVKALVIYVVARLLRSSHWEAIERAVFMAQGGEFAFVLYTAALSVGIITIEQSAILTAIIIISMVLTPLIIAALNVVEKSIPASLEGVQRPENLKGTVLIIGFGRVGQIVSQLLLDHGHDISIIDIDVEMINTAREFEFEVYYGDGKRLDILHAAGAGRSQAVVVCVDRAEDTTQIVELVKAEFPLVPVLARATDRRHALDLVKARVDFHIRETFESAMLLGQKALETLGAELHEIDAIAGNVRDRDEQRFQLEIAGGLYAGRPMFRGKREQPEIAPDA
ncbi:potassium transporter [Sinorhizobium meliloti]|uniref:monovalent cation:proton antiporter-2 (CPA2) family protein n=1 Tax=Rhizobium meliloti TaxID=382 RepID=UPI000EFADD23|nr:monovalent cation:proton antiporter-2 (CPA2) family protein [Sinorhizobium meliloti]RMC65314.1 potassium transporter [Sinorhizobium meliloti]RVH13427.1 potassium transporter [Sinorhizobium meliloti]RVH21072.1 potassium transporter [Sinorhizobium meliloti]RVH23352.1 potassium transporter [Sinorhizobium meliloti]RVI16288.1 potassium transporter [Sinorhizobium meliloti]